MSSQHHKECLEHLMQQITKGVKMSEQEFLESVRNADITPKMYKAINTQTARYFEKSNEYVIDFELYD